jgi:hypothetical protein
MNALRNMEPSVKSMLLSAALLIAAAGSAAAETGTTADACAGTGAGQTIPATHRARAVYEARFHAREYFECGVRAGNGLVWPATAPAMNQTVVRVE